MNVETFYFGFVQLSDALVLTLKVLKDLRGFQPGPEAGQASVSDLFPALVCDHVAVLLHDHQFGHCCDLVALLQLTETETRDKRRDLLEKDTWSNFASSTFYDFLSNFCTIN